MVGLTIASWRQHRRRYVATFVAMLLGVGFCAATLSLIAAARAGAADAVAPQYGKTDVVAYPSDKSTTALVSRVSRLPEVAAAAEVRSAYVQIGWPAGHAPGSVAVTEMPASPALRWQALTAGKYPRGPDQVIVDANLAAAQDVTLGTHLFVGSGASPARTVIVVGLVAPARGAVGVSPIFTGPDALRRWLVSDTWGELDMRGSPGLSQSILAERVRSLAPGLAAVTADSLRQEALSSLTNQVDVIGRFLQGFAIVALLVAGLVIVNTFRIVMTQRIRDLALLRCVGAARWQVFTISVGEAGLLGVCAAAVGTGAGIGLSALLVAAANRSSVDVPLSSVAPGMTTLVLPFVGGLMMVLAAAVAPAWWASRVAPLTALSQVAPVTIRSRAGAGQAGLGVLLGVVGSMLLAVAVQSGRLMPGIAGGLISFVGVLLLTTIVVPAAIRLAGNVVRVLPRRWRGGVPLELSVLNATRNPRRTAATAGALLVGVTLMSMMSVGAASVSATESGALDRVAPVDLTVSGGAVTQRLLEATRQVDGVRRVAALDGLRVQTGHRHLLVGSLSVADAKVIRDPELRAELARAGVVVVPVGSQAQLPHGSKPFTLRAGGGVAVRVTPILSSLIGGPMLVAPAVLEGLGGHPRPVALFAELAAHADPQTAVAGVQDAIAAASPARPLVVAGGFAKRSTYDRTIAMLLLVATALLGVAVVIALVGVGNTLSLSVIERTREHGLLRALGLTTGQLRLLLANEALLMAGSAALLGTALGVAYGWAGTLTLLQGATTTSPTLALPLARLLLIVGVAVAAGVLASVLPSRRAVRLSPTAALSAD